MIGCGPASGGDARQHLALEVEHLGHALEDDERHPPSAPAASASRHDGHAGDQPVDRRLGRKRPKRGKRGERRAHLGERRLGDARLVRRLARLDVDDGDGDGRRRRTPRRCRAPCGRRRGRQWHRVGSSEALREQRFEPGSVEMRRGRGSPACARCPEKSSPQMAEPIARKARASGVGTPASSPTEARNDSPMRHVLAHVAVLGQHDLLAPVAELGEPVVRAAAVHPLLAVPCVVVGERKMRRRRSPAPRARRCARRRAHR